MIDAGLYGPWAVIAGGSEGVGAGFARELSRAGINLVLIARKTGPLEETAAAARANGVEVRTLELDLLVPDSLARIREVTDDLEVGLLIFNAGASTYGHEFVTGDLAKFHEVIGLNVDKPLELVHHFGGPMTQRRRGGIILVGSLSGYVGAESLATYAAAKAFNRIFAEGLWMELAPYDVHVLDLVLGATRTPAMERGGLSFDIPGLNISDPDDVVREGLANIANGPVWVAGGNFPTASAQSGFPRREIVVQVAETTKAIMGV